MSIERRIAAKSPIEFRAAADGKPATISGYAAVYYDPANPGGTQFEMGRGVYERIAPGAFDTAIARDDVRALWNHDPNHILGRSAAKTLRLSVDATGLRYEIDLPDTSAGRDTAESIRRGDVSGSSFSFSIANRSIDQTYTSEGPDTIRTILRVNLYDVGPVTFPAYSGTSAESMRSLGEAADEAAKAIKAFAEAAAKMDAESRSRKLRIMEISDSTL